MGIRRRFSYSVVLGPSMDGFFEIVLVILEERKNDAFIFQSTQWITAPLAL